MIAWKEFNPSTLILNGKTMLNKLQPTFYTVAFSSDIDGVMELLNPLHLFSYNERHEKPPTVSINSAGHNLAWRDIAIYSWILPDVSELAVGELIFLTTMGISNMLYACESQYYLRALIEQLQTKGYANLAIIDDSPPGDLNEYNTHIGPVANGKLITTLQVNGHALQIVRVERTDEWMTLLWRWILERLYEANNIYAEFSLYVPQPHLNADADQIDMPKPVMASGNCTQQIATLYYNTVKDLGREDWAMFELTPNLMVIHYNLMPHLFIQKDLVSTENPKWSFLEQYDIKGEVLLVDFSCTMWHTYSIEGEKLCLINEAIKTLAQKHRMVEIRRSGRNKHSGENWLLSSIADSCKKKIIKNDLAVSHCGQVTSFRDYLYFFEEAQKCST